MIKKMKQRTKIALCVSALLILVIAASFSFKSLDHVYEKDCSFTVKVEDKAASSDFAAMKVFVEKSGYYVVCVQCGSEDEGLPVNGVLIRDSNGKIVDAGSGQRCDIEFQPAYYEKGEYSVEIKSLDSREEYEKFVENYIGESGTVSDYVDCSADGIYHPKCHVEFYVEDTTVRNIGILYGVMAGIVLVFLMLSIINKDDANGIKYDERQELARGRAFKIGFFTEMIGICAYILIKAMDVSVPMDDEVTVSVILFIGIAAFVTSSIVNDAYFTMTEDKRKVIIFFCLIATTNIIVAIINAVDGKLVVNGKLTISSINLMCAILLTYVMVVMLVKYFRDKGADDEES